MLRFACTGSRPEPYAAGPSLQLDLRITELSGRKVHTASLRVQIRIDPRRRRYTGAETDKLGDLFGAAHRWGETLNPLQLATVGVMLPSFTGTTTVPLNVPLTYDLDIAASKYFHALADGEIPLLLLFSGTLFYAGDNGVQVGLVPWHEEAEHRLPVAVWRAAMDEHFPGSGWVRLRRETIDALSAYRSAQAVPTWDEAIERLLKVAQR
ncbi:DUF6084 family protein [Pseudonocardia asaccharolytica]|uniref:Uncharacterized protein n=1 Tax=Pseudonocardia asaccharolytica DSM 44247 = NBRC 16224 TaxID=1123024 RepID=A0A511D925_9PSEU|nr:DUF6084 family protein [Pseudonocardia asaccharolytica]GEL20903.1 hypothetical protein PA7_47400 [Pseudonocardia asaccharolytica DSM 44247 = NBRC 16224]